MTVVPEHPARALFQDAFAGRLTRRELLQRAAAIGLSAPVVAALGHVSASRARAATEGEVPLTYSGWIHQYDRYPTRTRGNEDVVKPIHCEAETAPPAGCGAERFVAKVRDKNDGREMHMGGDPFS